MRRRLCLSRRGGGLRTQAKDCPKHNPKTLPANYPTSPDTPPIARIRPLNALEFHAMPKMRGEAAFATSMINAVYDHPFGPFTSAAALTHQADTALHFAFPEGRTDLAPLHNSATPTGATLTTERQVHPNTKTIPALALKSDSQLQIATIAAFDGHARMTATAIPTPQPLATPIAQETSALLRNDLQDTPVRDHPVQIADFPNLAANEAPANHSTRLTTSLLRNDAAFSAGIAHAIQAATANGDSVFELDMLDGMGGRLRIAVSASDGSVQISMLAGRIDMLDMLKRSLSLLLDDLAALGFTNVDLKLAEYGGDGTTHRLQLLEAGRQNPPRKSQGQPPITSNSTGMDLRL